MKNYFLKVISYDIAKDAGEYGRENFPDIEFVTRGITDHEQLEEGPFDVLLAYEFYPFTRTAEWEYQRKYINMCLSNLSDAGILVIGVPDCKRRENILQNKENILKEYTSGYGVEIVCLPSYRIYEKIKSWIWAEMISNILNKFRDSHYLIIMHQNNILLGSNKFSVK